MSDQQCNAKCPKQDMQSCGGTWRNSVYDTDYLGEEIDKQYPALQSSVCFLIVYFINIESSFFKKFHENSVKMKVLIFRLLERQLSESSTRFY